MYAGGGICLEVNAKIYILMTSSSWVVLSFIANSAHYGGAGVCASKSHNIHSTTTECFMQLLSLQLQHSNYYLPIGLAIVAKFVRNHAHISGSNPHGGLLDRCTNSPFTVRISNQPVCINVVVFYMNISVQQLNSISSGPIRVFFYWNHDDERPDCSYNPQPIQAKKGKEFTVSLVAVDQVNHTVPNATIRSYLSSSQGGLGENQHNQSTGKGCTNLTFNIFSSQPWIRAINSICRWAMQRHTFIETQIGYQLYCLWLSDWLSTQSGH